MKTRIGVLVLSFMVVTSIASVAQEYPTVELAGGYSYVNLNPSISQITSQNLNGGGGAFVYNFSPLFGIKADFDGYGGQTGLTTFLRNNYGYAGSVSGNVFTYMFGPQIKKHSGKFQPFGEGLFGAFHSNGYAPGTGISITTVQSSFSKPVQ